MIDYLRSWLNFNAGVAPVWVTLGPDHAPVERMMTAIDAHGIVLAKDGDTPGDAYPWHAIYRVSRRR